MDENQTIDPELWRDFLLAQMADEQVKQELIDHLALKSGVSPDKVDEVMHLLAETLLDMTRSN